MSLKDTIDKMYQIDDTKISKMASVDIASGGILPLPDKGESVTIRIISTPKLVRNEKIANKDGAVSVRCVIFGREADLQYDLWLASTIYKGILAAFKKTNTPVDNELNCLNGRIITIVGKDWPTAPKEMWKVDEVTRKPVSPKTYGVALRTDLEIGTTANNGGSQPDLMGF